MEAKPKKRKTGGNRSTSAKKSKTARSKKPSTTQPPALPARRGITPEAVIQWIRANEEVAIISSFCIGILIGAYMQD